MIGRLSTGATTNRSEQKLKTGSFGCRFSFVAKFLFDEVRLGGRIRI